MNIQPYLFRCLILCLLLSSCMISYAQSTYTSSFSLESEDIQRWEANNKQLFEVTVPNKAWTEKKVSRDLNQRGERALRINEWSKMDQQNLNRLKAAHGIWYENAEGMPSINFRKPILKYFYKTKNNFYDVYEDDFYLAVNPVLGLELNHMEAEWGYKNFRGVEAKGQMFKRIGFYTRLGDHQMFLDPYTYQLTKKENNLMGFDYFRNIERQKYDLFEATAYFNITVIENLMELTAGYDRHFVGYGLRSLIIDEEGAPQTFMNIQGRYQKWSYDFLYAELIDDFKEKHDQVLPRKYLQIHQLNYELTPRIRLGVFEKSILPSNISFNPLSVLPIPGLQTLRQNMGGRIQSEMGLQAKAIVGKGVTIYTQAFLKDFDWAKKSISDYRSQWAGQLGAQYYDAFTLPHLDLQAEFNIARPFVYSTYNKGENYTHYNQPIAHPYGSDFLEWIGKLRYQFHPKFNIYGIGSIAKQGEDIGHNYSGINPKEILLEEDLIPRDQYFVNLWKRKNFQSQLYLRGWLQYEWSPHVFLVGGIEYKKINASLDSEPSFELLAPFVGLYWHFTKRNLIY